MLRLIKGGMNVTKRQAHILFPLETGQHLDPQNPPCGGSSVTRPSKPTPGPPPKASGIEAPPVDEDETQTIIRLLTRIADDVVFLRNHCSG